MSCPPLLTLFFFFFNDTATTKIYTLPLHDALPILYFPAGAFMVPPLSLAVAADDAPATHRPHLQHLLDQADRKSTRLNSSHLVISYAVFCLKKKKDIMAQLWIMY